MSSESSVVALRLQTMIKIKNAAPEIPGKNATAEKEPGVAVQLIQVLFLSLSVIAVQGAVLLMKGFKLLKRKKVYPIVRRGEALRERRISAH